MSKPILVLLDDDKELRDSFKLEFEEQGFMVFAGGRTADLEESDIAVATHALVDMRMDRETGIEAIKKIRAALQAGKLSREEAAKEIAAVKKEFGNKKKPDPKSKYDTTVKKIDYDAKLKAAEKEIAALKKELRSKKKGKSKRTKSKRK